MPTVLKDKKQTARKEHICQFCGGVIPKGTMYRTQTNIYCGDIYNVKTHLECEEAAQLLDMYYECDDDGLSANDFQAFVEDYIADISEYLPRYPEMTHHDMVLEILMREDRCKNCDYRQMDDCNRICGCGYGVKGGQPIPIKCPKK